MKKLITPAAMALAMVFVPTNAHADGGSVASIYQQGVAAMKKGDSSTAKAKFAKVLSLDPSHGDARLQLIRLKNGKSNAGGLAKKHELKRITIKEIDLSQASLPDSLEYFSSMIDKDSKSPINFIIQDPQGKLKDKEISLKLKELPSSVVLDYILRAAGAKATFTKHAVEISPAN